MAFDGVAVAAIVSELNKKIKGGTITRIRQPERENLYLDIKKDGVKTLFISSSPSLPILYLTADSKGGDTPPAFCMLLRKHLQNGRIIDVSQPGLERVVNIDVEHRNELGELVTMRLCTEIMGKHSNTILIDSNGIILDSAKRIPSHVSSIREVLPGKEYFIPNTTSKSDPLSVKSLEEFYSKIDGNVPISKSIQKGFTGFSNELAELTADMAGIDSRMSANDLSPEKKEALYYSFNKVIIAIKEEDFHPTIAYTGNTPNTFFFLDYFKQNEGVYFEDESASAVLEKFYGEKMSSSVMRQKTADVRLIVSNAMSRAVKKLSLQEKQLKDTENADKDRLYGELLTSLCHEVTPGSKSAKLTNYYDGNIVEIPLKEELSPQENAQRYFMRYQKAKRTKQNLDVQIEETKKEIEALDSIAASVEICEDNADIAEIKKELADLGVIKRSSVSKKGASKTKSKPRCYISRDGFKIYVGKNNIQNEYVSFQIAKPDDWWFHANDIPGSHVIIKADGKDIPDTTFEDAGRLAAYYSKAGTNPSVEIDYTLRKNLKKKQGAAPGFVIYHTNYSMMASTDIKDLERVE